MKQHQTRTIIYCQLTDNSTIVKLQEFGNFVIAKYFYFRMQISIT